MSLSSCIAATRQQVRLRTRATNVRTYVHVRTSHPFPLCGSDLSPGLSYTSPLLPSHSSCLPPKTPVRKLTYMLHDYWYQVTVRYQSTRLETFRRVRSPANTKRKCTEKERCTSGREGREAPVARECLVIPPTRYAVSMRMQNKTGLQLQLPRRRVIVGE